VPTGVVFQGTSASLGVVNTIGTGRYRWDLGSLDASSAASMQITVQTDTVGSITNRAALATVTTDPSPGDHAALQETFVFGSMITELAVQGEEVHITFLTSPARSYDLQYASNLEFADWTNLETDVAGQDPQTSLVHINTSQSGAYRIRVP